MKYYIVRPPKKPTTANVETKQRMQIINEEGEIINNGQDGDDFGDNDMNGGGQDDDFDIKHVEVGFEENLIEVNQFAQDGNKSIHNLKDMFRVETNQRFTAFGGTNQQIQLNPFAIRKQVDVKRLKF